MTKQNAHGGLRGEWAASTYVSRTYTVKHRRSGLLEYRDASVSLTLGWHNVNVNTGQLTLGLIKLLLSSCFYMKMCRRTVFAEYCMKVGLPLASLYIL